MEVGGVESTARRWQCSPAGRGSVVSRPRAHWADSYSRSEAEELEVQAIRDFQEGRPPYPASPAVVWLCLVQHDQR